MKSEMVDLGVRTAIGVGAPTVVTSIQLEAFIGVQGSVLVAVCAGALAAIVFVKGKEPRMELYPVALGSVIFGCALTSLLEVVAKHVWNVDLQPKHLASIGILSGGLMRFIMPPLIEKIPKLVDSIHIPWFSKKGD